MTLTDCRPRCSTFHGKERRTRKTSPPRDNGASDGDPSAAKPDGDWWDEKEAEAKDVGLPLARSLLGSIVGLQQPDIF